MVFFQRLTGRASFVLVALLAAALIAAACSSSSDEDDAAGAASAAPASEPQQPGDGGETAAPAAPPDDAEASPVAAAGEEGEAPPAAAAEPEGAGAGGDGGEAPGDGGGATDGGTEPSKPEVVSETAGGSGAGGGELRDLQLGDLAAVEDLTFEGALRLDIRPNVPGEDDPFTGLGEIVISGAFSAPSDFEAAIRLGRGAPPLGIISVDDTLYVNAGFGWQEQPGRAAGLLGGFVDLEGLGVDPDALDLEEALSGLFEGLLDAFDETGTEATPFGSARRYSLEGDSLHDFVEQLAVAADDLLGEEADLDLTQFAGSSDRAAIEVLIDDATGTLVGLWAEIENLVIPNFDEDGNSLSFGELRFAMTINPEFGIPTSVILDVLDFNAEGPDGFSGDVTFDFSVEDINAGAMDIQPPI